MTKTIVVERVPLGYRPVDTPPSFPALPVLYLEFLENKEKVRPDLRNKASAPIFLPEDKIRPINSNLEFYKPEEPVVSERDIRAKLNERMKHSSEKRAPDPVIRDHRSVRERHQEEDRDRDKSREQEKYRERSKERSREERPRSPKDPEERQTREIQDMLGGAVPTVVPVSIPSSTTPLPPTLAELGGERVQVGGKVVQDMSYTPEDENYKKREMMFRFDILRKSYKEATIPEISEFTDLRTMERMYEDTVRRVALDSKVEGYKKFLQMGFFGIEFLFSTLFKIDMAGFAKQQLMSMNSYERLLIELGEKSLLEKTKSQWPTEVRLLFTIVMNGVMFVLMKSVMNGGLNGILGGGGGGLGGLMGGLMGGMGGGGLGGLMGALGGMGGGGAPSGLGGMSGVSGGSGEGVPEPKTRKMRGPQINPDDLGKKIN